jgi:hypothetical protein
MKRSKRTTITDAIDRHTADLLSTRNRDLRQDLADITYFVKPITKFTTNHDKPKFQKEC